MVLFFILIIQYPKLNPADSNNHRFFFSEADRLLLASDLLNFGVWEFEFSTSRLIWDNKMYDIYGVSKQDFNQTIEDFRKRVHPEDLPSADKAMQDIITVYEPLFAQFRIIRPNQEIRHIQGNVTCIRNQQHEPERLIGINHDVTDQLKSQHKIEEQNERLRKIAWMQSHEIRKPLANIIGLLHLYDISKMDAQLTQVMQYLKVSANELDDLIKRIIQRTNESDE